MSPPRISEVVGTATVIVRIGAEAKDYPLHQELLRYWSGYFRGALSGDWTETDDEVIHLEDVDIDAFQVFVDWLYTKRLPPCVYDLWKEGEKTPSVKFASYVLADRLLVAELKADLMDMIVHQFANKGIRPTPELIIHLFDNLPESDPMLQFVVDAYCLGDWSKSSKMKPEEEVDRLPRDALVRMTLQLNKLCFAEERFLRREDYDV
ncbi:hypothetical protein EK21DRAFT_107137 [Setomelanomma holmii]|uniref:BTB domain-containing protein n=1 Tax=Setomelanomma holmii TaxID=210430 RepID=A0A9P4HLA4_9PLEO|nr:hypothetical protein EK21DRAFT_107137 [Setomelanomma holmii]